MKMKYALYFLLIFTILGGIARRILDHIAWGKN